MRASRLVALLLLLQQRSRATAGDLADALEVSVRTVYRDVAALQAAGVPLWTEPGPGGGVRLVDGWRTRLDGLTPDEAGALFLAGAPGAMGELGLGTLLVAAHTKVQARERFHLDAPGWFHREEALPHLPAVASAVWQDRRIDVGYRRSDREVSRRLDPLGLVLKGGIWYLVARHRTDERTYRVGRLASVELLDERFERPGDFDLAAWWTASSAAFDRSVLRGRVRLRVSRHAASLLPHVVDMTAAREALDAAGPADADGWREVDLAVESAEVAAGQLLALGPGVEVLDPPELRAALRDAGLAMAANNEVR